jgi:hypothetical protein
MSQDGSDLMDVLLVHKAFLQRMSGSFHVYRMSRMSRTRFPGGCLDVSGLIDVQIFHWEVLTDVRSLSRLLDVTDVQEMFSRRMSKSSPNCWMSNASTITPVTDVPTVSLLTDVPDVHFHFS